MKQGARRWAQEEFGGAQLGDRRRVARLVGLAASAVVAPGGTVTSVVKTSAQREGAFRLLENPQVRAHAVARASHDATLRRCVAEPWVYVPVDGSSLSLTDRVGAREVGQVGVWKQRGRGLQVVSALAVSSNGTPIGLCGQSCWARTERSKRVKQRYKSLQTEMRYSVAMLADVHARFLAQAPKVQPWYQLDRAYDAWSVIRLAHEQKMRMTVRVSHNRKVRESKSEPRSYLFSCAQNAPSLGCYSLNVPALAGRPARVAVLEVRACRVSLELPVARKRRLFTAVMVVTAREINHPEPLHWRLLTTVPVTSMHDAVAVISGYATRWRVEEFHRAWKRGVCHVEDTQLRATALKNLSEL